MTDCAFRWSNKLGKICSHDMVWKFVWRQELVVALQFTAIVNAVWHMSLIYRRQCYAYVYYSLALDVSCRRLYIVMC